MNLQETKESRRQTKVDGVANWANGHTIDLLRNNNRHTFGRTMVGFVIVTPRVLLMTTVGLVDLNLPRSNILVKVATAPPPCLENVVLKLANRK